MTRKQRAAALRNLKKARRAQARGGRKTRKGRRSRAGWGKAHRPRVYHSKRGWRSGGLLHGVKVNPPLIPTLGSVKSILADGAYLTVGFVGTNAVVLAAKKFGIDKLWAGKSATVQALGDTALRVAAVPLVAWLGGMVFRNPSARRLITLGASGNAVYHGVKDIGAATGALAQVPYANELLLGGGVGDYLMGEYVSSLPSPVSETGGNPLVAMLQPGSDIYA